MGALWDSHYDGIKRLIDLNPARIAWERLYEKDNGRGVMAPDRERPPERKEAWVRISHQSGGVQEAAVAATGLTTNQSMYLVALCDVELETGDIITAEAGTIRKWKVGVVDELSVEGERYAIQAPLVRADGEENGL